MAGLLARASRPWQLGCALALPIPGVSRAAPLHPTGRNRALRGRQHTVERATARSGAKPSE